MILYRKLTKNINLKNFDFCLLPAYRCFENSILLAFLRIIKNSYCRKLWRIVDVSQYFYSMPIRHKRKLNEDFEQCTVYVHTVQKEGRGRIWTYSVVQYIFPSAGNKSRNLSTHCCFLNSTSAEVVILDILTMGFYWARCHLCQASSKEQNKFTPEFHLAQLLQPPPPPKKTHTNVK